MEIKEFDDMIKKYQELVKLVKPDWVRVDSNDDDPTLILEFKIK